MSNATTAPLGTPRVAHIHTATVQVKVLQIDKRQVTLSVFRQLPNRCLFDMETMVLRGTPWGLVRYAWPECAGHDHVVFQDAAGLARHCFTPDPPKAWRDERGNAEWQLERIVHATAWRWMSAWLRRGSCPPIEVVGESNEQQWLRVWVGNGSHTSLRLPYRWWYINKYGDRTPWPDVVAAYVAAARPDQVADGPDAPVAETVAVAIRTYCAYGPATAALTARWRTETERLRTTLDQLFIAV